MTNPVAWRCKDFADGWILFADEKKALDYQEQSGCLMEALFNTDLAAFDTAIAIELPCVSTVAYNSHEICRWFAKNIRERLVKGAA